MKTWNRSSIHHKRPRRPRSPSIPALLTTLLLASAGGVGYTAGGASFDSLKVMLPGSGCNIKGNISVNTGERIYHVPGQELYYETIITPNKGERWFCSEDDARRAGWRKARN